MSSSGIVLNVDYIPSYGRNWPTGSSGYVCGTIPYNDAPCMTANGSYSSSNIEERAPRTFASCCDGPIVNITSSVTDPSNPSYGAQCIAYCKVDFIRTLEPDRFGDYWNCLTEGPEGGANFDDTINGRVTCGWMDDSAHDICEISISVESVYSATATSTQSLVPWDKNATTTATTMTTPSCPAQRTAQSITSAAGSTATAKSGASAAARIMRGYKIIGVLSLLVSMSTI